MRLLMLILPLFALSVSAQTVYKCGNTYSQKPCGDAAKAVDIAPQHLDQDSWEARKHRRAKEEEQLERDRKALDVVEKQRAIEAARRAIDDKALAERRTADASRKFEDDYRRVREEITAMNLKPPNPTQVANNERVCKKAVSGRLKDPQSAKFQDFSATRPLPQVNVSKGEVYKGAAYYVKVSGKNSFGAYNGFQQAICMFDATETNLLSVEIL